MLRDWTSLGLLLGAVLLTAAGFALLHRLRALSRDLEQQKQLVAWYGKLLDRQSATYQVLDWDTTLVIDERGDAQERTRVRIEALGPSMRFVRLYFGCGWNQGARFRKRVKLSVRNILVDGTPGTSLSQTITWPRNGTMVAMIHFPEPQEQGSEVSFAIDLTWPGRCKPLIDGVPDPYRMKFWQSVKHVRYRIAMPPGASTYSEPIGSGKCSGRYQLDRSETDDGRELVTFEAFDVPASLSVGVRLELKNRAPRRVPASALPLT